MSGWVGERRCLFIIGCAVYIHETIYTTHANQVFGSRQTRRAGPDQRRSITLILVGLGRGEGRLYHVMCVFPPSTPSPIFYNTIYQTSVRIYILIGPNEVCISSMSSSSFSYSAHPSFSGVIISYFINWWVKKKISASVPTVRQSPNVRFDQS